MERIAIADAPKNATDFKLPDGRIIRLYLILTTPDDKLATADYVEVETRGYELTADGSFVVDDNQEPVMFRPQRARVPLANVRAGIESVKPAWTEQPLPEDEEQRAAMLADVPKSKTIPKGNGVNGERQQYGGRVFAYSDGIYEQVRQARLREIMANTPVSIAPLDQAAIDALKP